MPASNPFTEVKLLPPGHKKSLWWLYLLLAVLIAASLIFLLRGCKKEIVVADSANAYYGELSALPALDLGQPIHFSQRFTMKDGKILFYLVHNHQGEAKQGTIIPPTQTYLAIFDPEDSKFNRLDNVKVSNGWASRALLLSDEKLLVAGTPWDRSCNTREDDCPSPYRPAAYASLYDLKTGEETKVSNPDHLIYWHPFLVELPNEGFVVSTYSRVAGDPANDHPVRQYVYTYKTGSLQEAGIHMGLPYESTASLLLDNGQLLFANHQSLYLFDPKIKTSKFLRHTDLNNFSFEGFQDSSTVFLRRSGGSYHKGTPVHLYDYKTNQLFSIPFPEVDIKTGSFTDIIEDGIPRDIEGEDRKFVEDTKNNTSFYIAPTSDGTFLVTPLLQGKSFDNSIGLIRIADFKWLTRTKLAAAPKEIDSSLNGYTQDSVRLKDGRVLLLNRGAIMRGLVYTPSRQSTAEQKTAQDLLAKSKTQDVWENGRGKSMVSISEPHAVALNDGRILFLGPAQNERVTKDLDMEVISKTADLSKGQFGELYDPRTGKTKILTYPKFADQQMPTIAGVKAKDGKVHFITYATNKAWIFNPANDSLTVRDLKYSGKSKSALERWEWARVSPGSAITAVGNNLVFIQPGFERPGSYTAPRTPEEIAAYLKSAQTQNTLPMMVVYNPSNSTYYEVIKEAIAKVGDKGNINKKYEAIYKKLPQFSNENLGEGNQGGVQLDANRIVVFNGREVKLFDHKRFKTTHLATLEGGITKAFLTTRGDIVTYRQDGGILELINPRTKKVTKIGTSATTPQYQLPGDKLVSVGFKSHLIDIYSGESMFLSQPQILEGGKLIQDASGNLIAYGASKSDKPNPLNATTGSAPYLYIDTTKPEVIVRTEETGSFIRGEDGTNTPEKVLHYAPDYEYVLEPGEVEIFNPAPGAWGYHPKWNLFYSLWWAFLLLQIVQVAAGVCVIAYLYKQSRTQ